MRVRTAALVALAVLLVDLPAASASQDDLERARRQANAAASDVFRAETRLSRVQGQLADLEARRRATEQRLRGLQRAVREAAVSQYLRGGGGPGPLDVDPSDAAATVRAEALARMVAAQSSDVADAYRAAAADFAVVETRLSASRKDAATALADYRRRVSAATTQLRRLQALEADRIARDKARRAAAGRGSGKPTRPGSGQVIGKGDWVCPVQGPRAFGNDYGQPRGGGRRRHQGNDILSPQGTPVVAPVAGVATKHDNRLGGHAYYLHGTDGVTYYGAHLNAYSSNYGRVSAGTVLGWVGNTGDARGGPPHLHFEIHPGGGGPVNPYPTLRQYC
ncbi:MAG: putative metalloendopeptidase [Acidimicrobiales bacterium]|nr:putative metalloendopeptidase [Acidimicrobiales bacterium]